MKAMVLAAGIGSRLGSLTKQTPKCLMEAGGKTLLAHTFEKLKTVGVTTVVVNLYHLGDQIRTHVKANNSFGIEVVFSEEKVLLGTGGGLQAAGRYFMDSDEPFILHNSDVYSDIDLSELLAGHRNAKSTATLAVRERPTSRPLLFDSKKLLCGWENQSSGSGEVFGSSPELDRFAFCGVQILSPEIFAFMPFDAPFSTIESFVLAARNGKRIVGHLVNDVYWIDAGTPERLAELQALLAPRDGMQ